MPTLIAILSLLCGAPSPGMVRKARGLTARGEVAYREGNIAAALRYWTLADRLVPSAALLLRIGQGYERLDQPEEAIEAYRSYLKLAPKGSSRARVKRAIARLEHRNHGGVGVLAVIPLTPAPSMAPSLTLAPLVAVAPPPTVGPPAPPPLAIREAATQSNPNRWLLPAAGSGALGLAAIAGWYGGFGLDALSISSHNRSSAPSIDRGIYNAEIQRDTIQGVAGLSAAVLLAATGIYLWIEGTSSSGGSRSTLSAVPVAGGMVGSWACPIP